MNAVKDQSKTDYAFSSKSSQSFIRNCNIDTESYGMRKTWEVIMNEMRIMSKHFKNLVNKTKQSELMKQIVE